MAGRLGEQQGQQRHLLAEVGTAGDAQTAQHLLTYFPNAKNLGKYTT